MNHVRASLSVLLSCAVVGCSDSPAEPHPEPHVAVGSAMADPVFVLTEELINARDLGGTPLQQAEAVAYGALYRGPPLADLSSSGCDEFARLGIRSVIDLRIGDERAGIPEADCVSNSARVTVAALPVPYNVSAVDYIADLDATLSIAAAFRVLGDPEAYPVYFHCTYGRDRTGVLAAVILRALGASHEAILDEYLLSEPLVGASPGSLEAVLDELEARGGVEAYLSTSGVPSEQVDALRVRAIAQQR
jgi:protein-tyrosine phosphatase